MASLGRVPNHATPSSSPDGSMFIWSPSISLRPLPAMPYKSPYMPAVESITPRICSSRFAQRRVIVFRSLATSCSISVNFSTIASTWAQKRGPVRYSQTIPILVRRPALVWRTAATSSKDCRNAIATGTAQRGSTTRTPSMWSNASTSLGSVPSRRG